MPLIRINLAGDSSMSRSAHKLILFTLFVLFACASEPSQPQSAPANNHATPVLVELFTSEGCSSCPPADAWLQQLDAQQPVPGAQVIVLSEHVDYWNHDGWIDPYSSSLVTDRQAAYVRALGISSPYTPQLIVDGTTELQLENKKQTAEVLLKAAKAPQIPVSIGPIHVRGPTPALLRAHIEADGTSSRHNADIFAAVALDHAESQVLRGENGGRRLQHVAVVQELVKIGKLEKGKTFAQDFQLKLKPGQDSENLRLVVFVQESGPGNVIGAALREVWPRSQSAIGVALARIDRKTLSSQTPARLR
jgi:hypothetical protein